MYDFKEVRSGLNISQSIASYLERLTRRFFCWRTGPKT